MDGGQAIASSWLPSAGSYACYVVAVALAVLAVGVGASLAGFAVLATPGANAQIGSGLLGPASSSSLSRWERCCGFRRFDQSSGSGSGGFVVDDRNPARAGGRDLGERQRRAWVCTTARSNFRRAACGGRATKTERAREDHAPAPGRGGSASNGRRNLGLRWNGVAAWCLRPDQSPIGVPAPTRPPAGGRLPGEQLSSDGLVRQGMQLAVERQVFQRPHLDPTGNFGPHSQTAADLLQRQGPPLVEQPVPEPD